MTEELDALVETILSDPELGGKSRDEKLLYIYQKFPLLAVSGDPKLPYVLYKSRLTCDYFSVDPLAEGLTQKYCDDGFKSETTCTGLAQENCSWYKMRFFVDELRDSLNDEELQLYYSFWIQKIAKNYGVKRINEHLKKHLKEDWGEYSHRWFASTKNLADIYEAVKGTRKWNRQFRKSKKLLKKYTREITAEQQLSRLLNHYRNHPDKATPFPFRLNPDLIRDVKEMNKEYKLIS